VAAPAQKKDVFVAVSIAAAIIIVLLMFKRGTVVQNTTTPGVVNYEIPGWNIPGLSVVFNPTKNTVTPGTSCGCDNGNQDLATQTLNDYSQSLIAGMQQLETGYESLLYSTIPDYVTQYFNDVSGYNMSLNVPNALGY
jgi:hypothetical protein